MRGAFPVRLKRWFDVTVAAAGLVVASPVLAVVAVAIRTSMGTPVLFRQVRPGLGNRPFTLYKFRTMRDGPGDDAARLTPVGRAIRSSSLDELPQLWNVLRGDMSLVGPRPLLTEYLPHYSPQQQRRHHVRPGITGLAQVSGRNALTWDEQLRLDIEYVDGWSLWLDAVILGRTLNRVLRRSGVTQEGRATRDRFDQSGGS